MIHKFTPKELAERQSRAVKKVEQLGKDIMDYAHGIGELHRQQRQARAVKRAEDWGKTENNGKKGGIE